MISISQQFSETKVLVVGDLMLDRFWWGDVTRISPEAPVPVVRLKRDTYAPGGAANVAANVVGLGAGAFVVGYVGNDAESELLREAFQNSGISADHLIAGTTYPTAVKTRIIAHSQQVVRVDKEPYEGLGDSHEGECIAALEALLPMAGSVVISDYGKGFLTEGMIRFIVDRGSELGLPVLVDPKGRNYAKYKGATLITPNRKEAAEAVAMGEEDPELIEKAGPILRDEVGIRNVLITQGDRGMTLFLDNGSRIHIEAEPVQTYDVTGAGDTVVATVAVGVGAGLTLADAARLANTAGGIVVQQVGTSAITIDRLLAAVPSDFRLER
jgi:rfaE bifunctional protein kinase chain/domain